MSDQAEAIALSAPCPIAECAAVEGAPCVGAVDMMGRPMAYHAVRYGYAMDQQMERKAARAAMTDLDDLERKARAATPGPRIAEQFFREGDKPGTVAGRYRIFLLGADNPRTNSRDCDWTFADASYIAATAPDVVLALVAELRALRAEKAKSDAFAKALGFPVKP